MFASSDIAFLVAPLVLGLGVPAVFSASGKNSSCGAEVRKSSLQPPGWAFGVVWTVLYALYGAASVLAWRASGRRMTPALWASGVLLAGLVAWPVVFFRFCAPELAFAAILSLLGLAVAVAFMMPARWPALLSIPLVVWLSFASVLAFPLL